MDKALKALSITSARLYEVAVQADKELAACDGVTFTNDMGDEKPRPQIKILTDCNNQLRQNVKMLRDLNDEEGEQVEQTATVFSIIQGKRADRLAASQ